MQTESICSETFQREKKLMAKVREGVIGLHVGGTGLNGHLKLDAQVLAGKGAPRRHC